MCKNNKTLGISKKGKKNQVGDSRGRAYFERLFSRLSLPCLKIIYLDKKKTLKIAGMVTHISMYTRKKNPMNAKKLSPFLFFSLK